MHISLISIFPEIFESYLKTSLIAKAQEKKLLSFELINPRDFCTDKHRQIDDMPYGGGPGMLLKAQPLLDATRHAIKSQRSDHFRILMMSPSKIVFDQTIAHELSSINHLIIVCGRYEGIDHRYETIMTAEHSHKFQKISLGEFITMGGESPAMVMIEAITRLIPDVIKEEGSYTDESYNGKGLEYPHYTRPEIVEGHTIPDILLSGHHANIGAWREENRG